MKMLTVGKGPTPCPIGLPSGSSWLSSKTDLWHKGFLLGGVIPWVLVWRVFCNSSSGDGDLKGGTCLGNQRTGTEPDLLRPHYTRGFHNCHLIQSVWKLNTGGHLMPTLINSATEIQWSDFPGWRVPKWQSWKPESAVFSPKALISSPPPSNLQTWAFSLKKGNCQLFHLTSICLSRSPKYRVCLQNSLPAFSMH